LPRNRSYGKQRELNGSRAAQAPLSQRELSATKYEKLSAVVAVSPLSFGHAGGTVGGKRLLRRTGYPPGTYGFRRLILQELPHHGSSLV
jgi:hypothetical protein